MEPVRLINVGYGNVVQANRIICIINPDSASSKRLRNEAKESQLLIDATQGRKTRAIIITDSNHVILTAMLPETLSQRFNVPATVVAHVESVGV
ncbi:MAG: hypothetical protein A2015_14100 [Spirochaetes bacterium GWF1_31_7]|nr:MAG: hypothetical protein A2Y30_03650 [Spirochaetes bacterium GWE1_32_154]OHD45239.1 MAG: hypothetical protein A2Y29_02290 [Spirochaetes bacterium GWE2_31_10]OHD50534.1 MAG: hypothetical protein A2015_14100 [Spirochaetes bacterium GWF1_31_7]OHD79147.1 MAG: hypothetical protein A2355_11020 [Spirochaetes bacterium RIFOXYB1_FULL_32_8]HBD94184.1 DUF370 domain-containing protein [Spirochaetia bacterium]